MTFEQLHESIRQEIGRRIERGVLTGTLLARQTGLRPAHISNFLNRKRNLSLRALDLVIAAQLIQLADLLSPLDSPARLSQPSVGGVSVPLVPQSVARQSARFSTSSILESIHLPSTMLRSLPRLKPSQRKNWQRLAAVRISLEQSIPMQPLLPSGSLLILDRYDISLRPRRQSPPFVYAVNAGTEVVFAHLAMAPGLLILRPHAIDAELRAIPLSPAEPLSVHIIGRVCAAVSEL